MLDITKHYMTQNDCYKAGRKIVPRGVMPHSTGANNPNLRRYVGPDDGILGHNLYNNHWNQPGIKKCVHAFIGKDKHGKVRCYQTLPWNHRGWHAGSGTNGSANNTHISFEICEDDLTNRSYFNEVYDMAVKLTAFLCTTCNLNPLVQGVVVDHSEGHAMGIASNHADISHWLRRFGKNMGTFRADVAQAMQEEEDFMLEKAILINSFADFPAVEPLAERLDAPIYLRCGMKGLKAKEVLVCGGEIKGVPGESVVNLSGANRFETAARIHTYMKGLK